MIKAIRNAVTTTYHVDQRGNNGGFSSCESMSVAFSEKYAAQQAQCQTDQ